MRGGLFGLLSSAFDARTSRLDQDRDQHHLASMLISIAAGRDEVSRIDIAAHLRARRYSGAEVTVRMNHAVKLAGSAVSGTLYDDVVALAREMIAAT